MKGLRKRRKSEHVPVVRCPACHDPIIDFITGRPHTGDAVVTIFMLYDIHAHFMTHTVSEGRR